MFMEWIEYLVEYRGFFNYYIKRFILDCREMGLCFDNIENIDIVVVIYFIIMNVVFKVV